MINNYSEAVKGNFKGFKVLHVHIYTVCQIWNILWITVFLLMYKDLK